MLPLLGLFAACSRPHHHGASSPADEATPTPSAAPAAAATTPPPPAVAATPAAPADAPLALLSDDTPLDPTRDAWWMEKAARTLTRHERPVRADDASLAGLTRRQYVERLLADPDASESVLAFSLSYLGFADDKLRLPDGQLSPMLLDLPQAVAAARAYATGGDVLALQRLEQPLLATPLGAPELPQTDPAAPRPDDATIRAKLRALLLAKLDALAALAQDPVDHAAVCAALGVNDAADAGDDFVSLLTDYGAPPTLLDSVKAAPAWLGGLDEYCYGVPMATNALRQRLVALRERTPALLDALEATAPEYYRPMRVQDFKTFPESLALAPTPSLTQRVFFSLQNSSTNYDRRRGAYVLKRYFCDDLTPVNVEIPAQHAEGRHAADPSCQTCHYKLDPMAGFFRERGVLGFDFAKSEQIIFDDLVTIDRKSYDASWAAPAGSGRPWDVGYVRSSDDPSLNAYGSSLEDLFGIIQKAPEARQCLVRRMLEFYVGEQQVFDPGWVEGLAKDFSARVVADGGNGTGAFKETLARIALSRSFAEPDLVSTTCYDRPAGTPDGVAPPCAVAFLLQRHCTSCHSGGAPAAGLDLSGWIAVDGAHTFPHRRGGAQRTRLETLSALADRLSTTDADARMPPSVHIPSDDRERLFLWVNDQLTAPSKGQ
jgi:hypothetical protein